jgi:hypothetical protein
MEQHGEGAFQYEVVETIGEDELPLGVNDLLKEKRLHWTKQLRANAL